MKSKDPKKKLLAEGEKLFKEVCKIRDGGCKGFEIESSHKCKGFLQVDHCFSRTIPQLFLDIRNGTTMCQGLHFRKSYKVRGAEKLVDNFVRNREGEHWWQSALQICTSKKPSPWNILNLEMTVEYLKAKRDELLNRG